MMNFVVNLLFENIIVLYFYFKILLFSQMKDFTLIVPFLRNLEINLLFLLMPFNNDNKNESKYIPILYLIGVMVQSA